MSNPATHSSTAPPSTTAGSKSAGSRNHRLPANRDPGRNRRQHQRRPEPKMRQRREPLRIAVAQQKQPAPAAPTTAASDSAGTAACRRQIRPSKRSRTPPRSPRLKTPLGKCRPAVRGFSASIRWIGQAIERHRGAAGRDHADQNPQPIRSIATAPAAPAVHCGSTPSPPPTAQTAAQTAYG